MAKREKFRKYPRKVWAKAKEYYLYLSPDAAPLYGIGEIREMLLEEFDGDVVPAVESISRKAKRGQWAKDRAGVMADAIVRAAQERANALVVKADDKVYDEASSLAKAREEIVKSVAAFVQNTRKASEGALALINFELDLHRQAALEIQSMIKRGGWKDTDEFALVRRRMMSPAVLVKIAQLGNVLASGQVSLVMAQAPQGEADGTDPIVHTWGEDEFPPPPVAAQANAGRLIDVPQNEDEEADDGEDD